MVNAVKKYLMPSSNSIFPAPWIKRPTTDPTQEEDVISLWFVCKLLLFLLENLSMDSQHKLCHKLLWP